MRRVPIVPCDHQTRTNEEARHDQRRKCRNFGVALTWAKVATLPRQGPEGPRPIQCGGI